MNENEAGTHNTNWTGIWTVDQAGNIQFTHASNKVTLNLPEVLLDADACFEGTDVITNTTALPQRLRPSSAINVIMMVKNTAGNVLGRANIGTNGIIAIWADLDSTGFIDCVEAGGPSGFIAQPISYTSAIVDGWDNQNS